MINWIGFIFSKIFEESGIIFFIEKIKLLERRHNLSIKCDKI